MGEGQDRAMSTSVETLISSTAGGERDAKFAAYVQETQRRIFQIACVCADAVDAGIPSAIPDALQDIGVMRRHVKLERHQRDATYSAGWQSVKRQNACRLIPRKSPRRPARNLSFEERFLDSLGMKI